MSCARSVTRRSHKRRRVRAGVWLTAQHSRRLMFTEHGCYDAQMALTHTRRWHPSQAELRSEPLAHYVGATRRLQPQTWPAATPRFTTPLR